MTEYQCWFCDQGIERADADAVMMSVESLWRWDAGSQGGDGPVQAMYAHSACARERLRGATMALEPSVFGEDD